MEELFELLTFLKEAGGGGWAVAVIFLWMVRHDILKPLRANIENFESYFVRLIAAIEKRRTQENDNSRDLRSRHN